MMQPVKPQGSCGDAIDRQAAIEAFQMFREYESNRSNKEWVDRIETVLNQLPPVNPQSKTGHWIAQDIHNCHTDFKCSECGYIHSFMHIYGEPTADYTYCPNCGAKMQEIEE